MSLAAEEYPYSFTLNDVVCHATLPSTVFAPDELTSYRHMAGGRLHYKLVPSELDAIEPGMHTLRVQLPHSSYAKSERSDQKITVRKTADGKVVSADSFRSLMIGRSVGARLLNLFGFEINEKGEPQGIPTPKTLQAAARLRNVAVRLFPGRGLLGSEEYLRAFADHKYPVATGDQVSYLHDIGSDHLLGLFLGGPVLSDKLSQAATLGLQPSHAAKQDQITDGIDDYTMKLMLTTLGASNEFTSPPITISYDSSRLYEAGSNIGIASMYTEAILEYAKNTAQKWLP